MHPEFRSHLVPRTRPGRVATVLFVALLALTQPPFVFAIANRIDPRFAGAPFFFWYLLVLYCGAICVLIWAHRKRV